MSELRLACRSDRRLRVFRSEMQLEPLGLLLLQPWACDKSLLQPSYSDTQVRVG